MVEGTTLKVTALANDKITTSTGACYKLGPMPNGHAGKHADPKINDILVAVKNSRRNAPTLVSINRGCGCRFVIYPESN